MIALQINLSEIQEGEKKKKQNAIIRDGAYQGGKTSLIVIIGWRMLEFWIQLIPFILSFTRGGKGYNAITLEIM